MAPRGVGTGPRGLVLCAARPASKNRNNSRYVYIYIYSKRNRTLRKHVADTHTQNKHTHTTHTHTHTKKGGAKNTEKHKQRGVEDSGSQCSDFEENWCTRHSVLRRIRLHMPPGPKKSRSPRNSPKKSKPLNSPHIGPSAAVRERASQSLSQSAIGSTGAPVEVLTRFLRNSRERCPSRSSERRSSATTQIL